MISEYAKRDPGLEIILRDGDRAQLVAALNSGEIDAALGCFLQPVTDMRREHKVAMHPLTDPVVPVDLYQISSRARELPPGAEGFTAFLASYIAEWAEPWSPAVVQAA